VPPTAHCTRPSKMAATELASRQTDYRRDKAPRRSFADGCACSQGWRDSGHGWFTQICLHCASVLRGYRASRVSSPLKQNPATSSTYSANSLIA
jgi:hypothetical protein